MDYSKWDTLAKATDDEEERLKFERRHNNKETYMKEQARKQIKYEKDKEAKRQADKEKGIEVHDHTHDHTGHRTCGCGYADPEELKKIVAENAKKPFVSNEEKNAKKIAAVEATREHGNQLFKEGDYPLAFQVYERGVLIINGMYELNDTQYAEMTKLECMLDLNMAMCKLKEKDFLKAIDNCKMALNIDKKCVKGYYRIGLAYIGMGELLSAREQFLIAQKLAPSNKEVVKQLQHIKVLLGKQKEKERQFAVDMSKRMVQQQEKDKQQDEQNGNEEAGAAKEEAEATKEEEAESVTTGGEAAAAGAEGAEGSGEDQGKSRPTDQGVKQFLTSIGYERYVDSFYSEGYDSMEALRLMTLEDLEGIGVLRGHRKVIVSELGKL